MTSRAYCFTKHYDASEYAYDHEALPEPEEARLFAAIADAESMPDQLRDSIVRYCICQVELCPTTGAPHIQGYCELNKPVRWTTVRNSIAFFADVYGEVRRGSREDARDYCRKQESRVHGPVEMGRWDTGGQGKRSDILRYTEAIKAGYSNHQLAMEFPQTHFLHGGKAAAFRADCTERPKDADFVPRPWQQDLIDRIKEDADDRTIIWVLDSAGGKGKSRLARHLYCEYGATVLTGKTADMSYLYDGERIVVFDITRAAAEHSDNLYTMAEHIKNKMVVSTKYQPCIKAPKHNVHVVFFANQLPLEGKWSQDRVTIIDLNV